MFFVNHWKSSFIFIFFLYISGQSKTDCTKWVTAVLQWNKIKKFEISLYYLTILSCCCNNCQKVSNKVICNYNTHLYLTFLTNLCIDFLNLFQYQMLRYLFIELMRYFIKYSSNLDVLTINWNYRQAYKKKK